MQTEPQRGDFAGSETPITVGDEAAKRAAVDAYMEAVAVDVGDPPRAPADAPEATGDAAARHSQPSYEELKAALETARAEVDEQRNQVLRARADQENLKRRHAAELEKAHKFALDGFVRELLQVRDSLELGHSAALEDGADIVKLREGTELTLKLLADVMEKFGVAAVDPVTQPFDPELHQAMSLQPRDDVPPNTVVAVMQKGYTLNGRLVRPALVLVSQRAD